MVWEIVVAAYAFGLMEQDGAELFTFHWHPTGPSHMTEPHLHLGPRLSASGFDVSGVHVPTGQIGLAQVVLFAIRDLGVTPRRRDWRSILNEES